MEYAHGQRGFENDYWEIVLPSHAPCGINAASRAKYWVPAYLIDKALCLSQVHPVKHSLEGQDFVTLANSSCALCMYLLLTSRELCFTSRPLARLALYFMPTV